jgi:hypothetical protein
MSDMFLTKEEVSILNCLKVKGKQIRQLREMSLPARHEVAQFERHLEYGNQLASSADGRAHERPRLVQAPDACAVRACKAKQ